MDFCSHVILPADVGRKALHRCHLFGVPKSRLPPRPSTTLTSRGTNGMPGHYYLPIPSKDTFPAMICRLSSWFTQWENHEKLLPRGTGPLSSSSSDISVPFMHLTTVFGKLSDQHLGSRAGVVGVGIFSLELEFPPMEPITPI